MVIRDFPRFFPPKVLLSRLPLQRGGPLAAKQRLRFRREERCDITLRPAYMGHGFMVIVIIVLVPICSSYTGL